MNKYNFILSVSVLRHKKLMTKFNAIPTCMIDFTCTMFVLCKISI